MTPRSKIALQILVSGAVLAFLLWHIDIGRTANLIATSHALLLLAALAIFLATTWGLAWRWQTLLAARGIREPLGWLTKLYFVGYAAAQILPTAVGGDAVRIVEHSRRRPDAKGEAAGAVIMERLLGSAATLVLTAIGFAVAAGRFEDTRLLLTLEGVFLLVTLVVVCAVFSRRAGRWLVESVFPLGRVVRLDRPLASVYRALHGYRERPDVLAVVLGATVAIQGARIIAIWLCGEAVGVEVSPLVYVLLGPLLFLVMMVPFTINGLGVREAFFVAFLGRFGVEADAAFATGFLFYALTLATALPGGLVLLWRSTRPVFARARTG